jgi:hypothetical protein
MRINALVGGWPKSAPMLVVVNRRFEVEDFGSHHPASSTMQGRLIRTAGEEINSFYDSPPVPVLW